MLVHGWRFEKRCSWHDVEVQRVAVFGCVVFKGLSGPDGFGPYRQRYLLFPAAITADWNFGKQPLSGIQQPDLDLPDGHCLSFIHCRSRLVGILRWH
ncbi:hypothetical protein D3C81_1914430 [compost metagenome]